MKWSDFWLEVPNWQVAPKLPPWQRPLLAELKRRVPRADDVMWMLSSGTQSVNSLKALALSREGILTSAAAVNHHLQSSRSDRWAVVIPTYHVGGMSIYARAYLSGARVFRSADRWQARAFAAFVKQNKITLASLVPTQVFDLVAHKIPSPKTLRAVVVGGGALDPALYLSARELGWPLLPSYGLTECGSQVATAEVTSLKSSTWPPLKLLRHVQVEARNQRLYLRSPAICRWTAIVQAEGAFTLEDPLRPGGWLATEDLGEVLGKYLRLWGRRDDVVKVLGELVALPDVERFIRQYLSQHQISGSIAVVNTPDPRRGQELILVTDSNLELARWTGHLQKINSRLPGPQRLSGVCWVPEIPVGELGKIKKGLLRTLLLGS